MLAMLTRVVRQQFMGTLALMLVLGGLADAATGGNVVLGRVNSAGQTTTLRNNGNGPALSLKVKDGQPPLDVNSNKLVAGLNAQLLGGHPAKDFALGSSVYSKPQSDSRYAPASGSANYVASSAPQIIVADGRDTLAVDWDGTRQDTAKFGEFTARVPGTVTFTVTATCDQTKSSSPDLTIRLLGDFKQVPADDGSCDITDTVHLAAGQTALLYVFLYSQVLDAAGTADLEHVFGYFQPD